MMGLEPTTFCMASRRSSQLSYIRESNEYSRAETKTRAAARNGYRRMLSATSGGQPSRRRRTAWWRSTAFSVASIRTAFAL
jgi:hypothetical protein